MHKILLLLASLLSFGHHPAQTQNVLLGGLNTLRIGQQVQWTTDLVPSAGFTVNLGSSARPVNQIFGTKASISAGEFTSYASASNIYLGNSHLTSTASVSQSVVFPDASFTIIPWDLDSTTPLNGVYRVRSSLWNFLSNSSFEYWLNGTNVAPSNWTLQGDASVARSSTPATGTYAAQITFGTANTGELYQSVPTSTLVDYTYTCYVQRTSGTGGARLVAQDANSPFTEFVSVGLPTGAGYNLVALTFKPPSGTATRLNIKSSNGTASVWLVDDCLYQESKRVATAWQPRFLDDTTNGLTIFGTTNFAGGINIDNISELTAGGGIHLGNTTSISGNFEVSGYASLSDSIFIQQKGNVGIGGETNPTANLEIRGTASISNGFFVDSVGNVGMGTTSPQVNIDIERSDLTGDVGMYAIDSNTGVNAQSVFIAGRSLSVNTGGYAYMSFQGSGFSSTGSGVANSGHFFSGGKGGMVIEDWWASTSMQFWTGGSGGGGGSMKAVLNASSGNFGIGTTTKAPVQKLQVAGNILASTSGNVDLILQSSTNLDDKFTLRSVGTASNARLAFLSSASAELFTIASTGNVGVNNATPAAKFDVSGLAKFTNASISSNFEVVGYASASQYYVKDGTLSAPSLAFSSDTDTGIYRGTTNDIRLDGGGSDVAWNGDAWYPTNDTSRGLGYATNRWRDFFVMKASVSNGGFEDIGRASTSGTVFLHGITNSNTGDYLCWNTSTHEVEQNATACSLSSIRFKENIREIPYGLNEVLKMHPILYDLKPEYGVAKDQPGFIAEEAIKVVPDLVPVQDGKPTSFDYPKYVAVLTKAIQDQQIEIESLKQMKLGSAANKISPRPGLLTRFWLWLK